MTRPAAKAVPVLAPLHSSAAGTRGSIRDDVERRPADPFIVRAGLVLGAIVLILDQATKELAQDLLVRGRMVDVFADGWGWQLVYNPGGAFGFPAPSWFFLGVTVLVAVIVARNLPYVQVPSQAFAYGLLLAGALGNALDRVFRPGGPTDPRFLHGHVVDFIAWGDWPRFNVADVAITTGFALLLVSLWLEERALGREE